MNLELCHLISEKFGLFLQESSVEPVLGGDINECFKVKSISQKSYFIKLNRQPALLECESRNLNLLASSQITTPAIVGFTLLNGTAVLVLEYLELMPIGDELALGNRLAKLHKSQSESYGLGYNNYIGRTKQVNDWCNNWAEFWWTRRLLPQVTMATEAGFGLGMDVDSIKEVSDRLLRGHNPPASLLHGDLWAGNRGYLADGRPVLFDPACYYGDRETDLAFTLMFGGFGHEFYQSYQAAWPLPTGWQTRESLYNLYHFLNHLNLFGDEYLGSVQSILKSFKSDL